MDVSMEVNPEHEWVYCCINYPGPFFKPGVMIFSSDFPPEDFDLQGETWTMVCVMPNRLDLTHMIKAVVKKHEKELEFFITANLAGCGVDIYSLKGFMEDISVINMS